MKIAATAAWSRAGSPAPGSSPPWLGSAASRHPAGGLDSGFPDGVALTLGSLRRSHQKEPQLLHQKILQKMNITHSRLS